MERQTSKLKLTVQNGTATTSKVFGNINENASDEQLKQAGEIIGGLQTGAVHYISRIDEKILNEDAE